MNKIFKIARITAIGLASALMASSAALAANCSVPGKQDSTCTQILSYSSANNSAIQCSAMGGTYNWSSMQCQMASLPGSGGAGGWVAGEHLYDGDLRQQLQVVASGSSMILQAGAVVTVPQLTCTANNAAVDLNAGNWNASSNYYCPYGGSPTVTWSGNPNAPTATYTCPVSYQWMTASSGWWAPAQSYGACYSWQVGQVQPAHSYFQVQQQWDVTRTYVVFTNNNGVAGMGHTIMPAGDIFADGHNVYSIPWTLP